MEGKIKILRNMGLFTFSFFLFFSFSFLAEATVGADCQGRSDGALQNGKCQLAVSCPGSTNKATCDSGEVCCFGSQSCTGDNDTSIKGTCKAASQCPGIKKDTSASCTGGQICCEATSGTDTGGGANPNVNGACGGGTCRDAESACRAKGETPQGACNASRGSGICCVKPQATSSGGQQATINFTNPLAFNTVEEVLTKLLTTLQAIIVTLALVFLVIGAILYIISAGNEQRMETGKKAILAAMIGLAIGLAAPSFLKEIGQVLGWGPVNNAAVAGAQTLTQIALNVLHFLLSIVGILAIIMLVIGGLAYLTAAGNEERVENGKKIVKYSIIGIIIAFGALVIVTQIGNFFVAN